MVGSNLEFRCQLVREATNTESQLHRIFGSNYLIWMFNSYESVHREAKQDTKFFNLLWQNY